MASSASEQERNAAAKLLRNEVKALSRVRHNNVVRLLGVYIGTLVLLRVLFRMTDPLGAS